MELNVKDMEWNRVSSELHTGITDLWLEDNLTDFEIEVGLKTFRCHKVVLAATSGYFRALFTSKMKNPNKIVLDEVDSESFETIIRLLYPAHNTYPLDDISESRTLSLLILSERFQMNFLYSVIIQALQDSTVIENCISRWKLGKEIKCAKLTLYAKKFIEDHFVELLPGKTFASLEFEEFLEIIKSEDLHVLEEENVWSAIKSWVEFDEQNRGDCIDGLLKECCLAQLDNQILFEEILFNKHVRMNDEASRMVQDVVKFRSHPSIQGNIELKFRRCHDNQQVTFLVLKDIVRRGGRVVDKETDLQGLVLTNTSNYQIDFSDLWKATTPRKQFAEMACCVYGDSFYILTGIGRLWEFKSSTQNWKFRRQLDTHLQGHTMTCIDKYLYVLGGRSQSTGEWVDDDMSDGNTVWRYSIQNDAWWCDGFLLEAVHHASSVAVDTKIYVIGGNLFHKPHTSSVQVYDTVTQTCSILGSLPKPCHWSRALIRGDAIYIVTCEGDVMKIATCSGEMEILKIIPDFRRKYFGATMRDNVLTIFGGEPDQQAENGEEANDMVATEGSDVEPFRKCKELSVNLATGGIEQRYSLKNAGIKSCKVLGCVTMLMRMETLRLNLDY